MYNVIERNIASKKNENKKEKCSLLCIVRKYAN